MPCSLANGTWSNQLPAQPSTILPPQRPSQTMKARPWMQECSLAPAHDSEMGDAHVNAKEAP